MSAPMTAPYGTWKSPLSAQRVAAGARPLSAPRIAGASLVWLEGLPAEGGRVAALRLQANGQREVLTPAPFNVRTRVHEYGGGALAVQGDTLYFSNFADNLVYAQEGSGAPRPLTDNKLQRHADFELDASRRRLIAVREDHSAGGHEPSTSLVALPLDSSQPGTTLAAGADFYAAPRLSPDGKQLAWITWSHPRMPWNGTELWLADIDAQSALANSRRVAGGDTESLCQPAWSPAGELFVVSDRSGWWNLYRVRGDDLAPVYPMQAEFGQPMWVFAQSLYSFTGPHEMVAACFEGAVSRLFRIDLRSGTVSPLATPLTDIKEVRGGPGFVLVHAAAADRPEQIVRIDVATGSHDVVAQAITELPEARYLSTPQSITYPSGEGRVAHGFFYPPANGDCRGPEGELPPLIVTSHGGPTAGAFSGFATGIQLFTSRGYAVLDVDYGGSTGYGKAYRKRLEGEWGVVDVDDCVAGAKYLADKGLVDGSRQAVRGGSASGFTTLAALAFTDQFDAGCTYFGIGDLRAFVKDTHKFESRYLESLLGPWPDAKQVYLDRSPSLHAEQITAPVLVQQGAEDRIVPPSEAERIVDALFERRVPHAYLLYPGEDHGFRGHDAIIRSFGAELSFYAQVFGFEPADAIEPITIQFLDEARAAAG